MKIIFISGAITGIVNYKEKFAQAEEQIRAELGDNDITMIFNPARMIPESDTYEEQMRKCFALIDEADIVYMLKGWQRSRGANREYGYALGKKKTIIFQICGKELKWNERDEALKNSDVLCHTNLKENAEIIAKILDADVRREVFIDKIRAEIERERSYQRAIEEYDIATGLRKALDVIDECTKSKDI